MIWHHCQEQMVDSHATGQGRNNSDRKNKGERLGLRDRNKGRHHTQGQTRALGGGVCSALFEIFNFKNDFTTFYLCINVYCVHPCVCMWACSYNTGVAVRWQLEEMLHPSVMSGLGTKLRSSNLAILPPLVHLTDPYSAFECTDSPRSNPEMSARPLQAWLMTACKFITPDGKS